MEDSTWPPGPPGPPALQAHHQFGEPDKSEQGQAKLEGATQTQQQIGQKRTLPADEEYSQEQHKAQRISAEGALPPSMPLPAAPQPPGPPGRAIMQPGPPQPPGPSAALRPPGPPAVANATPQAMGQFSGQQQGHMGQQQQHQQHVPHYAQHDMTSQPAYGQPSGYDHQQHHEQQYGQQQPYPPYFNGYHQQQHVQQYGYQHSLQQYPDQYDAQQQVQQGAPAAANSGPSLPTTLQRSTSDGPSAPARRPTYSAKPVLHNAAAEQPPPPGEEAQEPQQHEQQVEQLGQEQEQYADGGVHVDEQQLPPPPRPTQQAEAGITKKALPPALLARLKARGLLPKEPEQDAGGAAPDPAAAEEALTPVPANGASAASQAAPAASASTAAAPTPSTAAAAMTAPATGPPPPGWYEAFDPTYQHPYWYNPNTGERSWVRPQAAANAGPAAPAADAASPSTAAAAAPAAAAAVAAAAPAATAAQPPAAAAPAALEPLPPGWFEARDPTTGKAYYYNAVTRVPQWKRPTAPAAPGAPAPAPWHAAPAPAIAAIPAAAPAAVAAAFIPATTFQGARFAYVFTTGAQGTGYYAESTLRLPSMAAAAPAGSVPAASAAHAGAMHPPAPRPVPHVGAPGQGGGSAGPRKTRQQQIAEAQAARNANRGYNAGRGRSGRGEELDPMDPAAYSDAPAGGWGSGLASAKEVQSLE